MASPTNSLSNLAKTDHVKGWPEDAIPVGIAVRLGGNSADLILHDDTAIHGMVNICRVPK